jgi:hypothetical protein
MSRSPPLRFLILLLAGWTGLRAAWLAPGWWARPAEAGGAPRPAASAPAPVVAPRIAGDVPRPPPRTDAALDQSTRFEARAPSPPRTADRGGTAAPEAPPWQAVAWQLPSRQAGGGPRAVPPGDVSAAESPRPPSRWSFSAWSFLRRGDAATLAPGGLLGGSQIGTRALFRLNRDSARPIAVALRLSSPTRRPGQPEAAAGIDWRPGRTIPVHILAERREGLGGGGRSAFALTFYGGLSDAPLGGLRVDAYAQAGLVGLASRDPFGDGAFRLSVPLGRLRVGAGAWAAAQPGAARLDLGPQASFRLPVAGRNVALAVDWRSRVAGGARPGSGPALTLATDF